MSAKKLRREGSVRVDLLGGTLDIHPINLVLEHAITLNVATELKAVVELEETERDGVEIHSLDYDSTQFFAHSFQVALGKSEKKFDRRTGEICLNHRISRGGSAVID